MHIPGTVTCSRCSKALPSLAAFCDDCGARVAPLATAPVSGGPVAVAVPSARPGFVAAGRGMAICHGCGAIAPTHSARCDTCHAAIGTSLEAVPPRPDGAFWVQVRSELTCRQCGKRSPLDALDLDGTVSCGHCGVAQAFEVEVWSEALAHAHAVGDLAAPALRAREDAAPGGNPFADVGISRASARFEATGLSVEGGVMRTRNLALVAAPGQPLCGACGCPVDIEVHGELARTRCVACGERAEYRFPARARQMAPGLVAAIAEDLRIDRPDARLDATSAGMVVAVRCPSCGGALEVPEGAHTARCGYCGTQCRIPSRTLLALRKSPGEAAPWWLLFRGPSALRDRLRTGRPERGDEPEPRPRVSAGTAGAEPEEEPQWLPMIESEHTGAEKAIAWALQITVPLIVLALVGATFFGPVMRSWAEGLTSTPPKTLAP